MKSKPSEAAQHSPLPGHAMNDLVRVNLLVPAAVRKEWKALALASDRTLTSVIIEAMQHQISRNKQQESPSI